jgi:hypothetical protein
MNADELEILLRGYVGQVLRGRSPLIDVAYVEADGNVIDIEFSVSADSPGVLKEVQGAVDALCEEIDRDGNIHIAEVLEVEGGMVVSVHGIPKGECRGHAADDDGHDDAGDEAGDALADAIDLIEGPMNLEGMSLPSCLPARETRVALVGIDMVEGKWVGKVCWEATYADLERARYWGLKAERDYKKHKVRAAGHVCWQHEASVDEIVAAAVKYISTESQD